MMKHLVFITDSLSLPRPWRKNFPLEYPENFLSYDQTYPFLLKESLEHSGHKTHTSMLAKRGGTSKDAVLSAEDGFFWRSPSIVILHIGIVDCWPRGDKGQLVTLKDFKENLLQLLNIKQKFANNIPLVVIGIAPTLPRIIAKNPTINQTISNYNQVIKNTLGDHAIFVDMEALFKKNGSSSLLHPDGHHLSQQGHELLSRKLHEILIGVFGANLQFCFDKLRRSILNSYKLEFINRSSDVLLIILSPNKNFVFTKYPFKYSCLYIADEKISYYLLHPHRQIEFIDNFINNMGYKKVIFIGSSKAGAGALLWSALLKGRNKMLDVGCLAFSPQTLLYPENDNIKIMPTYQALLKRKDLSSAYRINMETFGNIVDVVKSSQPKTRIAYSENYAMDFKEAHRFENSSWLSLVPVPFDFHGSLFAFITNKDDTKGVAALANKLFVDAKKDEDLEISLPEAKEAFIKMFQGLKIPSLNDYIDDFLNESFDIQGADS